MCLPIADYPELLSTMLEHIQVDSVEDLSEITGALRSLVVQGHAQQTSTSLQDRIKPIQDLLNPPNDEVREQKEWSAIKQVVHGQVVNKVAEFACLTHLQQQKYVDLCRQRAKAAKRFSDRISRVAMATLGSGGHVLPIDRWLQSEEVNASFRGRGMAFSAVMQHSYAIEHASAFLKNDLEFVLMAVTHNGDALQYARVDFRRNKEIVLAAVKSYGAALQYASEALRSDREIVLAAVKNNIWALLFASPDLRDDREIFLEVVKQNGMFLQSACDALKSDREVILAAVRNNGLALGYASEALRGDREVVLEAMRKNRYAIEYASEALKGDPEFILECKRIEGRVHEYVSERVPDVSSFEHDYNRFISGKTFCALL